MAIGASRVYHVNSNCSDLERALPFYEALGLAPVLRTVPSAPQPGAAFGLDEVAWDAWMMQGDDGPAGVALDLLEWRVPEPVGGPLAPGAPGFDRLVITVRDLDRALAAMRSTPGSVVSGPTPDPAESGSRTAIVRDPDGVRVQLVEGDQTRIARVVVTCTDLDAAFGYYRDVMGLDPEDERSGCLHDPGSPFVVQLVQSLDERRARRRGANELGLFRMAWSTDDCRRDEAIVRAAGSVPFAPTGSLSVGDDLPRLDVLFWPGPSGECLELIEVTADSGRLGA